MKGEGRRRSAGPDLRVCVCVCVCVCVIPRRTSPPIPLTTTGQHQPPGALAPPPPLSIVLKGSGRGECADRSSEKGPSVKERAGRHTHYSRVALESEPGLVALHEEGYTRTHLVHRGLTELGGEGRRRSAGPDLRVCLSVYMCVCDPRRRAHTHSLSTEGERKSKRSGKEMDGAEARVPTSCVCVCVCVCVFVLFPVERLHRSR